jgi:hypothetical protein
MEIRDEYRRGLEHRINPATRSRYQHPVSVESAEELELFATMTGFKAHEPDEQGISARVFGAVLDNAGAWNQRDVMHASFEELHVILYVEECAVIAVNLSELLSWGAEYGPLLRRQRQEWEESRPVRANKLLHRLVECGMVGIGTSVKEWKQAQVSVCDHIDGPGSNMSRASRIVRALREEKLLKEPVISGSVAVVARAVGDVNEEG